jgi:CheY-like chemotaxis protein
MPARILVIEDDSTMLELFRYLLEAAGHAVTTAVDGAAGLDLARSQRPDLIACDIQLPLLDGYGVARALADDPRLCSVPRIAITALAMVGDREKILKAGFDDYLSKPIEPETFVANLDRYLPPALRSQPEPAQGD